MARYHARKGVIYLSNSAAAAAAQMASMASFTVDQTVEIVDVTSFGDTTKTYVTGLPDGKGDITGFFDDATVDTIWQGLASATGVNMYLYPSSDAASKYWYGNVFLSPRVEANVRDAVKVSISYVARSGLGRN